MRRSAMVLFWNATSLFLILACSWFALMELLLQHPGFAVRACIATLIVLYAALCLRYARTPSDILRSILNLAALGTFAVGLYALITGLHTAHFEGYIVLIAVGLLSQSLLAVPVLVRPRLRLA